jgi:hypothetical protein
MVLLPDGTTRRRHPRTPRAEAPKRS